MGYEQVTYHFYYENHVLVEIIWRKEEGDIHFIGTHGF